MDRNIEIKTDATGENRPRKLFTLAFILKDEQVLLGLKKRGFGEGKWNGFGGKVNLNEETIVEAASREIEEECGLIVKPENLEKFAVIDFEFVDQPTIMEVHAYKTCNFSGEIIESDEMRPKWWPIDETPHELMWADDYYWFPFFRKNVKFKAYFLFKDNSTILSYKIRDYFKDTQILLESNNN